MSEVDQELLDMVGGDSEDEVDDLDRLDEVNDVEETRSPSPEVQQSVEKVEETQSSRRGVAQKVKSRGRRKRKQQSDDEDVDASPSPAESIRSGGGAVESDGEADAPGEDDDEVEFPYEGQFYSKAERDDIMALPEIEREAIIAERAEKIERLRQDKILKKALAASQNASKQKRKASSAGLEDGSRGRTTRPKTDKRSALDDYRRAREEKDAARNRRETARDRRDERSPSSHSDRDADGESEVEWAEPAHESRRDEPQAELKDFERCRVGRSNFAKICFYPGFEETMKGCFARVSIGLNRETGQNQYRMTQIRGFTEGKPYQMENAHGKNFTTDQYAIVAQGSAEKPWPFSACSDSKFTESEFGRLMDTLKKDSIRPPSRKFLNAKLDAIHELLHQKFTEETLQIKFAKQRAMEQKYDPVHVAKQKRKDIAKRRAEAEANGDEEALANCDAELEALDNSGSTTNGAVKARPSPAKPMNQERLAQLNATNRSKNQQEVRQALIAERKKIMKEREAQAARKTAEVKARVEEKAHARAARREQLQKEAMTDLFGESPAGSRAGTPANGTDTPKRARAGTPATQNGGKKGPVGALKQKNLDDDVIGGLDLDIDIEI